MSEGGLFAWKIQTIDNGRGPAGSYTNMRLPTPPKDQHWVQDVDTKEWHLVNIVPTTDITIPEAKVEEEAAQPDNLRHTIVPSDTFQGICLKYKITLTELRRANGGFSGTNLHLAPNPLRIPINPKYREAMSKEDAKVETPAQSIRRLLFYLPKLAPTEAKCYLELNDWNIEKALENAKEDGF